MGDFDWDVIVVGGGPAGLAAGLMLGRCRRRTLVVDAGRPRNAASHGLHGYLTRDGLTPAEFLAKGRAELGRYGVELRTVEATDAVSLPVGEGGGFAVTLATGETERCRKLLLATGVRDRLPEVPGIAELYGRAVHHCPYCDGWEHRDRRLAVYGRGKSGTALSVKLTGWSADVALFTDGKPLLARHRELLARHAIAVHTAAIARVEGRDGCLERVVLADGTAVERDALFFTTGQDPSCDLAERLDCATTDKGTVLADHRERTRVPGLFVAGDASRDMQFVIVAAAEGTKAAVAIHEELEGERLRAV